MVQPDSNRALAVNLPVGDDAAAPSPIGHPPGNESSVQPRTEARAPGADSTMRVEGPADELASRIESLWLFFPEQGGAVAGGGLNVPDSLTPAALVRIRPPESAPSPNENTRVSSSPSSSETAGPPQAAPDVVETRAALDAIEKLEQRLGALTVLENLHKGFGERLVRAEQTLERIEGFLADRALIDLCARVDERLVRQEETLRRIDAIVADRTVQQISARTDARLGKAEGTLQRIERLVDGGSLRDLAAKGNERLARIEADLHRIERFIHAESPAERVSIAAGPAGSTGVSSGRARWSAAAAAMKRVDPARLARRAAAMFVLAAAVVLVSLRLDPVELSEAGVIPSRQLPIRPMPVFIAPVLTAPSTTLASTELSTQEPDAAPPSDPGQVVFRRPAAARAVEVRDGVSSVQFVGTLRVASVPAGAAVFVNGQPVGTTPLTLPEQRAGSLALLITRDGFQRWSAAVQVPAGQSTQVNATLRPATP
jgi:hypothetical protein